jgi:uncharacterized delta-60 repeat protein
MKAPSITPIALSAVLFSLPMQFALARESAVRVDPSLQAEISGSVAAIVAAPDGSVTLGGEFSAVNGASRAGLARLGADGSLDAGYAPLADGPVAALAALPDGSIAVGGRFTRIDQAVTPNFAVLSPAGEPQPGWPGTLGGVACLSVNDSGHVALGGSLQSVQGEERLYLARFQAAGTLDAAFTPVLQRSWAIEAGVSAVAALSGGEVVAGGVFETAAGPKSLVRLGADGSLDASFAGECGPILYVGAILPLADGRLYVAGQDTDGRGFVRRLNADRSIDASFSAPAFDGMVSALALDARGRILAGGAFHSPAPAVARLKQDGSFDPTWDAPLEGVVRAIAVDSKQRILVGGYLSTGSGHSGLLRLVDSSSISAFSTNAGTFRARLQAEAGRTYAIEASTDLSTWAEVTTQMATAQGLEIIDQNSSGRRHRFFRARLVQ